jgi:5-methylcytosine-specific restriction endonuclease McrA
MPDAIARHAHQKVHHEIDPERVCNACGLAGFYEQREKSRGPGKGRRLLWECINCRRVNRRRRYAEDPDAGPAMSARYMQWRRDNPDNAREVDAVNSANQRARRLGLQATLTIVQWREIKVRHGNHCAWPGCESTDIQLDHIIPLCNGGASVAENIQPLCEPHNQQKGAA